MQNIINDDLLTITVNPFKHRLYCSMKGFWHYDMRKTGQMNSMFQQLSQQKGIHTVVLDTSAMKIMQPKVAERFLPAFTNYLLNTHIKAFAHVGAPDNVILRMQFQRVLSHVQRSSEVRHNTFQQQQDADQWLDTL